MLKTGLANRTASQGVTSRCTCDTKVCLYMKNIYSDVAVHPYDLCQYLSPLPERACCLQVGNKTEVSHKGLAEIQLSQKRLLKKGSWLLSRIRVFWIT